MQKKQTVSSLQDLADMAGVSSSTASRALSDSPLLNVKTKKKLQDLARKHNYSVNKQARDFRLQQTRVISVVFMLDVHSDQHPSDPFFLEMLGGIADELAMHDYDLLLAHAPIASARVLANSRIVKYADGVIFIGQGEEHDFLNELTDSGTHLVVWGGPVADKHYVLVGSDNLGGGYAATSHLLEQGRQRIAFFGNRRSPENIDRFRGYQKALADFGAEANDQLIIEVPSDMHQAKAMALNTIRAGMRFDALVCTSDVMAMATLSAFSEMGISIPDDIAVVGYDDIHLANFSSPPLTTVRQNIPEAGKVLVTSILGLINDREVGDTTLNSELIIRKSSGL